MSIISLVILCDFLIVFLLANKVYFEDKKNPMNRTFALGCLSVALSLFVILMNIQSANPKEAFLWAKLQFIVEFCLPFFLHYILLFTKSSLLKYKLTYIILYLIPVAFTMIHLTTAQIVPVRLISGYSFEWESKLLFGLRDIWLVMQVFFFIALCFIYARKASGKEKVQAKYLGLTFGLIVFPGIVSIFIIEILGVNPIIPKKLIFIGIILPFTTFIFYLIRNYKLFEVDLGAAAENIISAMTESLILLDRNCNIVNLNQVARNLLGFSETELVGIPVNKVFADKNFHIELGKRVDNDECLTNYETGFITKKGEMIPIILSSSLLKDEKNELGGVVIVARDISEQKQAEQRLKESEEKYRLLIENAWAAIMIIDRSGRVEYMNNITIKVLGIKLEYDREKTLWDILPQENADGLYKAILAVIHSKRGNIRESPLVLQGVIYWLNTNIQPIPDATGAVSKVLIISNNISKLKYNEQALIEQAEKLTKSNAELHEFVYIASHDLQEPLRKVMAFSDRLKMICSDSFSEQGKDYMSRMQNAVIRMQALINDLLVYSRVTMKTQAFIKINLTQIVKEVVSDLESRIEQTGGSVEVGMLPIIEADPTQMRQLFQNLIGNALKFRKLEAPPVIKINSSLFNDDRVTKYEISIEDNGIGIEEKYLDRVFGVFQQLHNHDEYEGTGIGLAICKKIVEWHSGSITVESKSNVGSRFIIKIPISQI